VWILRQRKLLPFNALPLHAGLKISFLCHLPLNVYHLAFSICHLPLHAGLTISFLCHFLFTIYHLPFTIYHLPFTIKFTGLNIIFLCPLHLTQRLDIKFYLPFIIICRFDNNFSLTFTKTCSLKISFLCHLPSTI
jgi:hypothetical protein